MAMEGDTDTFAHLKKLGRDYQEARDALEVEDTVLANLKLEERLGSITKLATIIENPDVFQEFKAQRRLQKEQSRLFEISRGYSIDRKAILVW